MFGFLDSLARAAVGVVATPVALVADVVTMGGVLTDKDKPYTAEVVGNVIQNLTDATKPQ